MTFGSIMHGCTQVMAIQSDHLTLEQLRWDDMHRLLLAVGSLCVCPSASPMSIVQSPWIAKFPCQLLHAGGKHCLAPTARVTPEDPVMYVNVYDVP